MTERVLYGLLGETLDHSLSPLIFNLYFKRSRKNFRYELFPMKHEDLNGFLKKVRFSSIKGLNVTFPFKGKVISLLDDWNEEARCIGSVNVVHREGRKLKGYNTDWWGFLESLKGRDVRRIKRAVILGAGGASRSVIYALHRLGVREIVFFSRNLKKAQKLHDDLSFIRGLRAERWIPQYINSEIKEADCVVNATPVGMVPREKECPVGERAVFKEKSLVYDLVYRPRITRFLERAKSSGALIQNGESMLAYQALGSLRIWNPDETDECVFLQTSEEVFDAALSHSG